MEYQIALSPDLGLEPDDFVSAWNATEEARAVAEARLSPASSTNYDPFLIGAIAVLSSVGLGVATNAIYDLIKQVFARHGVHKRTRITQVDQPDGTHMIVVEIEE